MDFYMPARLFTGEGAVKAHADVFRAYGARCAVICGKHAARESGALDDVEQVFMEKELECFLWDGVTENPPVAACREAGLFAFENGADYVLGIGGGSALDAAKAAAVFAANPELDEDGFYQKAWKNDPLPILLIGTTSGTGSEVTKVSVLTDNKGKKHSIHDDRLYAAAAFGDARYTQGISRRLTLTTGVDILAHALESYFSRKADEITRACSVRALKLAYKPIAAAAEGRELTAGQRQALYEGSILAGLAINTTGTCFPHNVGYYLTESRGVPHGFASAAFLPDMIELVAEENADYAVRLFWATDLSECLIKELVEPLIAEERISMTEEEIDAALPRWENNGSVKNTLAQVGTKEIRDILVRKFVR